MESYFWARCSMPYKDKTKKREHARKYRLANKEKVLETERKYGEAKKEVIRGYSKQWRTENKEAIKQKTKADRLTNKERYKTYDLKKSYGITSQDYNKMLEEQNNCCKICGFEYIPPAKYLCVDHNHTTGVIRGLLCDKCNRGLGHFNDNQELLVKAIEYLARYDKEKK